MRRKTKSLVAAIMNPQAETQWPDSKVILKGEQH